EARPGYRLSAATDQRGPWTIHGCDSIRWRRDSTREREPERIGQRGRVDQLNGLSCRQSYGGASKTSLRFSLRRAPPSWLIEVERTTENPRITDPAVGMRVFPLDRWPAQGQNWGALPKADFLQVTPGPCSNSTA